MLDFRKPGGILASAVDQFRVIASGFITPTGTAGSERATINMTAISPAPAVGDFMFFFSPAGNGTNAAGTVDQHTGVAFTTDTFAWMYDGCYAFSTLDANHLTATAMRFLARSGYRVYWCIIRSNSGSTTGTVKTKMLTDVGTSSSLSIAGYTKSGASKGHFMHVVDRDPTTTFAPPAGHSALNVSLGTSLDGVFSRASAILTKPALYTSLSALVWSLTGAQTYSQSGILFELT